MYKIHLDYPEVELNIITPKSMMKYSEFLLSQTAKDSEGLKQKLYDSLKENLEGKELKAEKLVEMIKESGLKQLLESLEIYYNEDFIFGWLPVLFVLGDYDYKKDWLDKLSIDEFTRGLQDFFLRLKEPQKKQKA